MPELHTKFIDDCVGLDIEVDPQTAEIFAMAAISQSTGETIDYNNRNIQEFLNKLEKLLGQSCYLVGHNLLRFDLEHIIAKQSHFSKYVNRSIDTLWLSPLAYPLKKSHRLEKPHLDPTLKDGRKQDPELDSLLALKLLENQQSELAKQDESLLVAYTICRQDAKPCTDSTRFSTICATRQHLVGSQGLKRYIRISMAKPVKQGWMRKLYGFQLQNTAGHWHML